MKAKYLAAAVSALALMGSAATASAAVYNLDVYQTGFTGNLGTVTVLGEGTNTLNFTITLANNVYFQMTGNGSAHDAFWFDLVGTPNVTFNITSPDGAAAGTGDYPTGGKFTAATDYNDFGQGFLNNYDYGLRVSDSSAGSNLNYFTGTVAFTATATNPNSVLNFATRNVSGETIAMGGDLRQCTTSCITGPVGATLTGAVPEPATWAMMIMGFGAVGAAMRRRRSAVAFA